MENPPIASNPPADGEDSGRVAFVKDVCLPFLRESQNEDGGWAFQQGHESRVEPTAWASLALQACSSNGAAQNTLDRGLQFLANAQLENGGWAAAPGDLEGCWVTSLALWSIANKKEYAGNRARGLQWLNADKPADSGMVWRLGRTLFGRKQVSEQSASLFGWSWTPHTASWVEPTSYAMIVEQSEASTSSEIAQRYRVAEQMLYDRMCPGGGWNCGNPRVYGVAGQPQVGPTVWALIALRANSQRSENVQSLDWLSGNLDAIKSPESLALAHIGLGAYRRSTPALTESLCRMHASGGPSWSVEAVSWTALAFSGTSRWLDAIFKGNS
jgi:hypothetical protein